MLQFRGGDGMNNEQMVIDLQKLAGIQETKESALKIWKNFSEDEKEQTKTVHKLFFGPGRN